MLSRYISEEELENIRNDKEQRNEAYKGYIKLVERELEKIEQERKTMMKARTRQRKLDIGMTYLAEAILEVIKDEGIKTDGKVSTNRINDVLEFDTDWKRDMCRSVLDFMAENGEIINDNQGVQGPGMWRLNI